VTVLQTTGTWDPADRHTYFLAGDGRPSHTGYPHQYVLLAVNELCDGSGNVKAKQRDRVETLLDNDVRVVIDSGVFWLTNEHKRAHNITMDAALSLAPTEIDGFDWLWSSYLAVHRLWGDKVWGYIELDQGGADNKRKTRAKLHDEGITPMPVYHPLNDGWEYFDELASTHDRLCCGNIVQAPAPLRMRLIHTISERHRAYPDLWVHFLGFTPNQWINALPVDSCDSSTWLDSVRWAPAKDWVMSAALVMKPVVSRTVTVRWTFDGWHHWPDAPSHRAYLADSHRHLFHAAVTISVAHDNRDVEFHDLQDTAKACTPPGRDWKDWSCERIAEHVASQISREVDGPIAVSIGEDGECDATVTIG
jgi:hypothetical protein